MKTTRILHAMFRCPTGRIILAFILTIASVLPLDAGTIIIRNVTEPSSTGIDFGFTNPHFLTVNTGSLAGNYAAAGAVFGPPLDNTGVTGNLELVNDGVDVASDGCSTPLAGFTPGNIAVIDRGYCLFTTKVLNAQYAGAIAVIVVNNVPGGGATIMGGSSAGITIPAICIGKEDGDLLKAQLSANVVINATVRSQLGGNFTLQHGGTKTFSDVLAGTYTLSEQDPFSQGYQLTAVAIDDPDNGSSVDIGTRTVTIDLDPDETVQFTFTNTYTNFQPAIYCPANITVQNTPDHCDQSVEFAVHSTGPTTVECRVGTATITSPHSFPVGTTMVYCTATSDVYGSASCSFTVTVQDTQHPAIICPEDMVVRPTSLAGAVVTYSAPLGTDNCSVTIQQVAGMASGATFPIGVTTNTFIATDGAGNTVSSSFTVTVPDPQCTPGDKVFVCHKGQTLCISVAALQAHLNHGDVLGPCSLDGNGQMVQEIPTRFGLLQNYPNPFNPTTRISYELPADVFVSLEVYNRLGQKVAQLVEGNMTAGYHSVDFDATTLPSGMYFYRIHAGDFVSARKLLVVK